MSEKPTKPETDAAEKKPVPQPGTAGAQPEAPPTTATPPDGNGVARRFIQRHRKTLNGLSKK